MDEHGVIMNTTSLMVIQPDELDTIQRTGRLLAASGYFDAKGEGSQAIAQMATKIIAGREMGIGPFASVNGIHIIQGKPAIGANLQAAAVKSSGRYDYRVRELTDKVCKIEFLERAGDKWESLGVSEFTYADGVKAQTKNLDKFPKNMLFARAMSNGVRFYVPDVFNGNAVYVPEELGADVDGDGNVIDVTPRIVEPSTGEIVDAPELPKLSDEQRKKLNAIGNDLYGDEWDTWRHTYAQTASNGRTMSSGELTRQEASTLIEKLDTLLRFEDLGQELYAEQWPAVCRRNVERVSAGATKKSDELTTEQLQMLIDGMMTVKSKRAAANAQEPIATVA